MAAHSSSYPILPAITEWVEGANSNISYGMSGSAVYDSHTKAWVGLLSHQRLLLQPNSSKMPISSDGAVVSNQPLIIRSETIHQFLNQVLVLGKTIPYAQRISSGDHEGQGRAIRIGQYRLDWNRLKNRSVLEADQDKNISLMPGGDPIGVGGGNEYDRGYPKISEDGWMQISFVGTSKVNESLMGPSWLPKSIEDQIETSLLRSSTGRIRWAQLFWQEGSQIESYRMRSFEQSLSRIRQGYIPVLVADSKTEKSNFKSSEYEQSIVDIRKRVTELSHESVKLDFLIKINWLIDLVMIADPQVIRADHVRELLQVNEVWGMLYLAKSSETTSLIESLKNLANQLSLNEIEGNK